MTSLGHHQCVPAALRHDCRVKASDHSKQPGLNMSTPLGLPRRLSSQMSAIQAGALTNPRELFSDLNTSHVVVFSGQGKGPCLIHTMYVRRMYERRADAVERSTVVSTGVVPDGPSFAVIPIDQVPGALHILISNATSFSSRANLRQLPLACKPLSFPAYSTSLLVRLAFGVGLALAKACREELGLLVVQQQTCVKVGRGQADDAAENRLSLSSLFFFSPALQSKQLHRQSGATSDFVQLQSAQSVVGKGRVSFVNSQGERGQ